MPYNSLTTNYKHSNTKKTFMKLLKSKLFGLCLITMFISLYSCQSSSGLNKFYDGTWTGNVDGQKIQLTCDSKNNIYMILYTATGCTGRWEPEQAGKNKVIFNEKIEIGKRTCSALNTKVQVTKINNDEMRISYYGLDGSSGSNAGYLWRE